MKIRPQGYGPDYPNPMAFDMAVASGPVFAMMRRGIRIDEGRRRRMLAEYQNRWEAAQEKLNTVVGKPLNANSPKQVKHWLYKELGLPTRRKQGSVTANEDALRALMAICEDKVRTLKTYEAKERWLRGYLSIRFLLDIRGLRKRIGSYLDIAIDEDGRIRSTLSVGGTETGRFSSSKTLWGTGCNLQTIPRELRLMFVADDGYELAEFDLNRGESWVYAHLSNDPELLRIHTSFGDFHSETASAISIAFGDDHYSVEDVIRLYKDGDKFGYKLRYLGKKVNHASAYQMGPFRGAEVVNSESDDTGITVTVGQMRTAQDLWRQKYIRMPEWWGGIESQLNDDRTLQTPYGRRRTFFGWWGDHLFKEATAYVPQSTSVDYLNLGMLKVYNDLDKTGLVQLLHQNHDSIVIQYKERLRDEVLGEVRSRLESTLRIGDHEFVIPVEGSYGHSWGELVDWKG